MKKSILLFALLILLSATSTVIAQISVSSYPIHALGVQTAFGNRVALELKLFIDPDNYLDEMQIEPTLFYTFRQRNYHRFAAGVGFNFNLNGDFYYLTIPAQLEIFPLQDFKKLSIILELSLMFPYEEPMLRHLLGIRYRFGAN